MSNLLKKIRNITHHQYYHMSILFVGIFNALILCTLNGKYLTQIAGIEMIFLSLCLLLLRNYKLWFFRALRIIAISLPFIAAIPYRLWSSVPSDALMLGGLSLIVAIPLYMLSSWGFRWLESNPQEESNDPPFVKWLNLLIHIGVWLILISLKEWFADETLTIAGVMLGAAILVISLVSLIALRVRLTRFGVGRLVMILGGVAFILTIVLMLVGGPNVSPSEAALGFIPGGIVAFLGYFISNGAETSSLTAPIINIDAPDLDLPDTNPPPSTDETSGLADAGAGDAADAADMADAADAADALDILGLG